MNEIKAYLYSEDPLDSANGKWDYGLIKEVFDKNHIKQVSVSKIPKADRGFVVIPGSGNAGEESKINMQIANLEKVTLFITGDEDAMFNVDEIKHPNINIWIHYPHKKHSKYNKFFIGVPQHLKENLPEYPTKEYDVYFSGQITHPRRVQLAEVMLKIPNSLYNPTDGFAKGYSVKEYYEKLSKAKIAPAPAGAVVIDSFRFFEAIEMLCLPIGDMKDASGERFNFFEFVFNGKIPVEILSNWNMLELILPETLKEYPNNMHRVVCWWLKYKRDLSIKIMRQINE